MIIYNDTFGNLVDPIHIRNRKDKKILFHMNVIPLHYLAFLGKENCLNFCDYKVESDGHNTEDSIAFDNLNMLREFTKENSSEICLSHVVLSFPAFFVCAFSKVYFIPRNKLTLFHLYLNTLNFDVFLSLLQLGGDHGLYNSFEEWYK